METHVSKWLTSRAAQCQTKNVADKNGSFKSSHHAD